MLVREWSGSTKILLVLSFLKEVVFIPPTRASFKFKCSRTDSPKGSLLVAQYEDKIVVECGIIKG